MSKKLPNYQEKQHILYIKRPSATDLIAYGDAFLEAGKISDAVDFYQKVNYVAGLEKIRGVAMLSGDIMVLQQVVKSLKQNIPDETWNAIGQRALELKKYAFALHAFEKARNENMVGQIKGIIKAEDNIKH